MPRHPAARRIGLACLAGLLAVGGRSAGAQRGTLRATVIDTTGAPISGVEISIVSLGRVVRTDSAGRSQLSALSRGSLDLSFRRLGYQQQAKSVFVDGGRFDSVRVVLIPQAAALSGVNVMAIGQHPFFQGFDQRRAQGLGTFITRDQIDSHNSTTPSDIFRTVPQVRLVRAGSGLGIRFPTSLTVRRGEMCAPMIWLDGQAANGLEIDDLRSSDIQAIELYRGAATTPQQFVTGGLVQCGAVVVWTRRKG